MISDESSLIHVMPLHKDGEQKFLWSAGVAVLYIYELDPGNNRLSSLIDTPT